MGETVDAEERAKMEAMGYAIVDDAADWLELTDVERQIVDLRLRLGREIRRRAGSGPGFLHRLSSPRKSDRPNRVLRKRRGRRLGLPST